MITKLLIWIGYSLMIVCVMAVVGLAALGCVVAAIASGCTAVLLALVCRVETDALCEWRGKSQPYSNSSDL